MGPEGDDKLKAYVKKFGPQAERMLKDPNNQFVRLSNHLNQQAARIDPTNTKYPPVDFKYHDGSRVFNTMKCHKLVAHEAVEANTEAQNKLMEVMFRKYFSEGKDLSDNNEIFDAAKECGISKEVVEDSIVKDNSALENKVKSEIASLRGVRGVPYFMFPNGATVNGSESVEAFKEILEDCAGK